MPRLEETVKYQTGEPRLRREEEKVQARSKAAASKAAKPKTSPRPRYQAKHSWRIGQYKPASPIIPLQVNDGASDPFSATAFPIDHFHRHLLPILTRGYLYEYLHYVFPDHPNPGMQWVRNLYANEGTIHAMYIFSDALAAPLPQGKILQQVHVRAHQVQALAALRRGLQQPEYDQSLAEINTLLSGYSTLTGEIAELKMHTRASKEITLKMGGISKLDPIGRGIHLLTGPIVHGRTLTYPSFPSQDFEMLAPRDDPVLRRYGFNCDGYKIACGSAWRPKAVRRAQTIPQNLLCVSHTAWLLFSTSRAKLARHSLSRFEAD